MTTMKPSPASRAATAAPMPRDAPVTIATLLVFWVIFSLLIMIRGQSAWNETEMSLCAWGIIVQNSVSQSENGEQRDGQVRRHAGVHAGGGATQLHARG